MNNESILSLFDEINRLEIPVSESKEPSVEQSDRVLLEVLSGIAEDIQRLMEENAFTQEELCRRANMSQSNLSRIRNCKVVPSLATLQKIATATHTKLVISFESIEGDEF